MLEEHITQPSANNTIDDALINSFINVCKKKDEELIKDFFNKRIKNNKYLIINSSKTTILHIMAFYNCYYLIDSWSKKIDIKDIVNIENDNGLTPLHIATINKSKDMAIILLKNGADPDKKTTKEIDLDEEDNKLYNEMEKIDDTLSPEFKIFNFKKRIKSELSMATKVVRYVARIDQAFTATNIKFSKGSTALHITAHNNLLDLVESLLLCGADINIKNDEGKKAIDINEEIFNKIFVRIDKKLEDKWKNIIYGIENRKSLSDNDLSKLIDEACKNYNGSYETRLKDEKLLDDKICEILKIKEETLQKDTIKSFKYLAHLRDTKGSVSAENKSTKLEGWNRESFLPFRIRYLFEQIIKIKSKNILKNHLPDNIENVIKKLTNELLIEIETFMTIIDSLKLQVFKSKEYKIMFLQAHVSQVAKKIASLNEGEEYCYATGFKGHTLYVCFQRLNDNIVIRVDNLGSGFDANYHELDTEKGIFGEYQYGESALIGSINILEFKKFLENKTHPLFAYLCDICKAQYKEKAEAKSLIYSNIIKNNYRFNSDKKLLEWSFKKLQGVGNCTVKNHNIGLQKRLSLEKEENKLDERRLYKWFRHHEYLFAARKRMSQKDKIYESLLKNFKNINNSSSITEDEELNIRRLTRETLLDKENDTNSSIDEQLDEINVLSKIKEIASLKNQLNKSRFKDRAQNVTTIQALTRGFLSRNHHSGISLKEQRKIEIQAKLPDAMARLAALGKYEDMAKLVEALKQDKLHQAMQIIRDKPEQEIAAGNRRIKY